MLELVGVVKRFGPLVVTNEVSVSLRQGSIGALIGPNGAGKTSLFNLISGFIRPDAGDIVLNGASIVGLAPERVCAAGVGRTFQIVQPFAGLTVRENIAVGAHLHRPGRAAALRHAQQVAEEVGLGAQILSDLGLTQIRLITNRPRRVAALEGFGIHIVEQVPTFEPQSAAAQK